VIRLLVIRLLLSRLLLSRTILLAYKYDALSHCFHSLGSPDHHPVSYSAALLPLPPVSILPSPNSNPVRDKAIC